MNTKLIRLLVSVCIGLCLLAAGEWLYASTMRHRLLTSLIEEKTQDYKADELPKIDLVKQLEDSYVDLVSRPLFIKDRKAVNEPSPEAAQAAAQSENFDWQLSGIYSTKKTVSALLSRAKSKAAKDNYRKITVGDDLDGWKLTDIKKDSIMFKQGSKEKELLLRKPKPKSLPQKVNSAVPPPPIPNTPAPAPAAIPESEPAADTTEDTSEGQNQ